MRYYITYSIDAVIGGYIVTSGDAGMTSPNIVGVMTSREDVLRVLTTDLEGQILKNVPAEVEQAFTLAKSA